MPDFSHGPEPPDSKDKSTQAPPPVSDSKDSATQTSLSSSNLSESSDKSADKGSVKNSVKGSDKSGTEANPGSNKTKGSLSDELERALDLDFPGDTARDTITYPDLSEMPEIDPPTNKQQSKVDVDSVFHASQQDQKCGICMEWVIRKTSYPFGLLENCRHPFCWLCISRWRDTHQTKRCPHCRMVSPRMLIWPEWISSRDRKVGLLNAQHYYGGGTARCEEDCERGGVPPTGGRVQLAVRAVQERPWLGCLLASSVTCFLVALLLDATVHLVRLFH